MKFKNVGTLINSVTSECPLGSHGEKCKHSCSSHCKNECSQQTGHCYGGCISGYTGDTCETGKDFCFLTKACVIFAFGMNI